jgi:uncharacterized membrane protein
MKRHFTEKLIIISILVAIGLIIYQMNLPTATPHSNNILCIPLVVLGVIALFIASIIGSDYRPTNNYKK